MDMKVYKRPSRSLIPPLTDGEPISDIATDWFINKYLTEI